MTAVQLRRLLAVAGLSQEGAAALELDIDERIMRKYVAGDLRIPRALEYALRWIVYQQDEVKRLERR